jgi:predicted TPR repeat methyltransferase
MNSIYKSGAYLETTKSWHAEDASWKAARIKAILDKNAVRPRSIAEIGCGSGAILDELSKSEDLRDASFDGYDISPQAIEIAKRIGNRNIRFSELDLLSEPPQRRFDLLLAIDVFEHVPDYMGFLEGCRQRAEYKVYHIPLDIHVSSVMRNAFVRNRYTIGHIHYFTAESAVSTLEDTGHEIVDSAYTDIGLGLFREHPTMKRAIANMPRWLLSKFSLPVTARLLGGYSLLVLTR